MASSPGNSGDLSAVARLIRVYMTGHWGALALAAFCMVITSVMTAALAWIIDPAIKEIFLDKNSHMVLVLPLGVLAVIAVRAVAGFGQDSILNAIAERIVALAQRDMFASQIGLDIGAQNANHSGELISKFIYDTGLLRNALTRGVAGFGKELITLLALIGVMLYQDWELTVISVVLLPPVAWVTERLGKSLRKYSTRGMEETGVLSKSLSEALSGRRIIKAYNLEGHAAELANRRIAERLKYLLRAVRARAAAVPSTDLIGGIAAAFTVAFAGYQGLQGHLEINEFSSFIAAMLLAQQPVRTLSQLWTTSAEGLSAARRIFSVIDAKPAIADRPGAAPLVLTGGGGAIAFQDVSFAYAQAGDARAIDHVSLDIAAGRKVALVGPSGAGKTTIFNLLLRFYDPSAGTIAIDGQDIGGVTLTSLRDHIALVTQEPFLFDETIAENIALGRPGASREEIEVAARAAAAHDFIVAMPLGYDSGVGEAGSKLSGGQRQRIAIARAMLRNAPILLLDEATSALDTESERQVQDALARLMRGRTTIVIAHRLSTVLNADRIYVMDRGRVVEAGTHGELLARAGLYARLYQHDLSDVEENALAAAGAG